MNIRIDALLLRWFVVAPFSDVRTVIVTILISLLLVSWVVPWVVLHAFRGIILGQPGIRGSRRRAKRASLRGGTNRSWLCVSCWATTRMLA